MSQHHQAMNTMKMYFHFGFEDHFLFEQLNIDSSVKLWATCAGLFLLTILFEAIKYARCVRCGCIINRSAHTSPNGNVCPSDLQDNEPNVRLAAHSCYVGKLRSRRHRLIQTVLHTLQTALGFVLMLSVMSFNVCIIFAILAGTAIGYYVFYRSYNEVEAIDSCH
uniref:Copper transport protein n=1 Tax=Aceria tosichella TaxID=561515 RepID=A0A6G1SEJ5_9ACAR